MLQAVDANPVRSTQRVSSELGVVKCVLVVWLGFYGISTFVGYLWHIKLCRLFNVKYIFYTNDQFNFKQFSFA